MTSSLLELPTTTKFHIFLTPGCTLDLELDNWEITSSGDDENTETSCRDECVWTSGWQLSRSQKERADGWKVCTQKTRTNTKLTYSFLSASPQGWLLHTTLTTMAFKLSTVVQYIHMYFAFTFENKILCGPYLQFISPTTLPSGAELLSMALPRGQRKLQGKKLPGNGPILFDLAILPPVVFKKHQRKQNVYRQIAPRHLQSGVSVSPLISTSSPMRLGRIDAV